MATSPAAVTSLTGDEVRAICEHYRLPPPSRVEALSRPWMHANFGLRFDPAHGDLMVRRVVCEPGWDTLHNELAGLVLAREVEGLPIVDRYHILPEGLIAGRASLSRLLPGTPLARLKDHPGFLPVCQQVGTMLSALAASTRPWFGTSPNGRTFLPTTATWRAEWEQWAHLWLDRARVAGELADRVSGLQARLAESLAALDDAATFGLVHGDLHSGNLLARAHGDTLELTGLVDWDQARIGDPLVDWAVVIDAPSEVLGAIVQGYGRDRVRTMLDEAPLARLEVYALTRALARIGVLALDLFRGHGALRATAVTLAVQHADIALTPGSVRRRLEAALGGTVAHRDPVAAPVPMLARRALQLFVGGPPVRADQAGEVLLALSAAAMADRAPPGVAERYLALGHGVLDALPEQPIRAHDRDDISLDDLKTRVYEAILARSDPGASVSISLLAAAVTAAGLCGGGPTRGLWSGVAALIEATSYLEEHGGPPQGVGRLAHALMGLDAAFVLDAGHAVVTRYGAVLTGFGGIDAGAPGRARGYLEQGPPAGVPSGAKAQALAPLILAMARLEATDHLRVPADAVLKQLGFLG